MQTRWLLLLAISATASTTRLANAEEVVPRAIEKLADRTSRTGACAGYEDDREICLPRDIYFMPGIVASVFAPAAFADRPFVGGGVELTPMRWSHNNDDFGPSQGAVFLRASLLQSTASPATLALFDLGYTLSFERNSSRNWLVPYFGGTLGHLSHEELPAATYTYQFVGMHLYWDENLVVGVEGGYQFPFSSVDELRGPRGQATVAFSMW